MISTFMILVGITLIVLAALNLISIGLLLPILLLALGVILKIGKLLLVLAVWGSQ